MSATAAPNAPSNPTIATVRRILVIIFFLAFSTTYSVIVPSTTTAPSVRYALTDNGFQSSGRVWATVRMSLSALAV